jgi:hypothetical protein
MAIMETQVKSNEQVPTCCSYCNEEKKFLMVKPRAFVVKGELILNVNHTKTTLWTCLECLGVEIECQGLDVEIYDHED